LIFAAALRLAAQTPAVAPTPVSASEPEATRHFELKANSPKFWKLVDKNTSIEKIADGFRFTEGPVWDEKAGFLYVSER
jgi:gluconolactonase